MQDSGRQGKLRRFAGLDAADKWLFVRAIAALALARLGLAIVPFERRMARWPEREPEAGNSSPDPELLRRVAFAVTSAAANVPWRSDCLPRAIAARALLKRRGCVPTIHLGVERLGDDALAGHAWLTCGNAVVVGGEELGRYTEVHRFTG
jgi:hypothetical protein